ncbi:MAG TPA: hypothetical protein VF156_15555 [Agromyces sp.]
MDRSGSNAPNLSGAVDLSGLKDKPRDRDEHFEGLLALVASDPSPRMWNDDDGGHADTMFVAGHTTVLETVASILSSGHVDVPEHIHEEVSRVGLIDRRGLAWLEALIASGADRDECLIAYMAASEATRMHQSLLAQVVTQVLAGARRAMEHEHAIDAMMGRRP